MATVYFTKPVTSDLRADVLQYIRDATNAQSRMFDGDTLVSPSVGVIRYVAANNRFEKWNGTVWNTLNITGNVTPTPPGGSTTHVQFNDGGGNFGGDSGLTWDKTNDILAIGVGGVIDNSLSAYGNTLRPNASIGGWAAGSHWAKQSDNARLGAVGMYGNNESVIHWRVGYHTNWWLSGEGMTFTVGGNLAVGNALVPQAWHTNRRAFELAKKGFGFSTNTSLNSVTLFTNLYEDATTWKYAAASTPSFAVNIGQNGYALEVWNAGTGSADTAVSGWTNMFVVNGSGNMGIGVTPSAWASGKRALEIGALGHGFQTALGQVIMCQNTYYNGTSWIYANTDRAWMLDLGSANQFAIYYAASGTAGNAISWGTHMVIDSAGTARFIKPSGGLTDYTNGNIEIRTASGDAGIGFHNGGANASSLIVGRSSAIFEFLNNPTSTHQQIKCHNVQTTSYIYGLNGNAINTYGGLAIRGEKNGYAGVSFNRGDATYMFTFMIDTGRGYFGIYDEARGAWPLYTSAFTSTTKVWVVEGNWYCTQNILAYYSDERLKTKLGRITGALDKVDQLEGFYYVQNDLGNKLMGVDHRVRLALSAQDVQKVAPEVVGLAPFDSHFESGCDTPTSKSGEEYLTVQYERLVPLLVEALKEAHARIKRLEERYG